MAIIPVAMLWKIQTTMVSALAGFIKWCATSSNLSPKDSSLYFSSGCQAGKTSHTRKFDKKVLLMAVRNGRQCWHNRACKLSFLFSFCVTFKPSNTPCCSLNKLDINRIESSTGASTSDNLIKPTLEQPTGLKKQLPYSYRQVES